MIGHERKGITELCFKAWGLIGIWICLTPPKCYGKRWYNYGHHSGKSLKPVMFKMILALLAVYMTNRPVSWIRIFIRVNKIWEPPTFRFLTWVIKWEKSLKHYWLFLHSSKDTANPFWHQVMASWCMCCCTHALAPKRNWKKLYQGRSFFPLQILKHLNLYFYFNLTNINFSDVSQCAQSK